MEGAAASPNPPSEEPSGSWSSRSSPRSARTALAVHIAANITALLVAWLIHTDPEIPWQYRFWGKVGMGVAALIQGPSLVKLVGELAGRLPLLRK